MAKKAFNAGQLIPTSSTPPSNAGFYRIDKNTIGVVGNMVQKNAQTNVESNVASGSNLAAELATIGMSPSLLSENQLPVLCIGGDHPYRQLWGNNGSDGLVGLYNKFGIKPYIAINTNSLTSEAVGDPGMMTWSQVKALADSGKAEIVSHGARHYQDWECPDAGISIKYTGAAGTAVAYVTLTSVVGVTAGSVDDFTVLFSSYPTLSALCAAISALSGWSAVYSPELTGSELSSNLLTISVGNAKTCIVADTRGQRFSAAGGLRVFWDSLITYCDTCVVYVTSTSLNIARDGVRIASWTLSSYTLGTLLTAIKALNPALASVDSFAGADITSLINDNGSYAYCTGVEDATNLSRNSATARHFNAKRLPAILTGGGLTPGYLRARNMEVAKNTASSNGVVLECFAQSGGMFFQDIAQRVNVNNYVQMRGNSRYGQVAPMAMPTRLARNGFHTHISFKGHYNSIDYVNTLVDALVASPGFLCNFLIHSVLTDATVTDGSVAGSSGFYLNSPSPTADINEDSMVQLLTRIAEVRDAKKLRVVNMADIGTIAASSLPPRNMIFNSKLIARATANLLVTDNVGRSLTGWKIDGFQQQAVNIIDGGLEFVSNGSLASILTHRIILSHSKHYRVGARYETSGGQATDISIRVYPVYGDWPGIVANKPLNYISSLQSTFPYTEIDFVVEIPSPRGYGNARIVSLNAGPYNLSTNKNIQVQLEGTTAFDIDCSAGAVSSSAVTAKEVATAINAAISANAQFASKSELHTTARAENGYVVLELARRQSLPTSNGTLQINNGSTASATTTIFGATAQGCYAWADHGGEVALNSFPVDVVFRVNAPSGTKIRVFDPYVSPILPAV